MPVDTDVSNNMTALIAISLLAAAIAPFIVALFARPDTPSSTKRLIAAGVAIVLGILTAIVTGQFTWASDELVDGLTATLISIGIVMTLAQGFYRQFKDAVVQIEVAAHPNPKPVELLEESEPDVIPESVWDENLPPDQFADDDLDEETDPVEQDKQDTDPPQGSSAQQLHP